MNWKTMELKRMPGLDYWRDLSLREKRLFILSGVLALFCLSLLLYTFHLRPENGGEPEGLVTLEGAGNPEQKPESATISPEGRTDAAGTKETSGESSVPKKIAVDVKGAVKHPGVYEIAESQRVIDVIQLSGGMLDNADVSKVNLAAHLTDGSVLYIPSIGEEAAPAFASPTGTGAQSADGPVNINTAGLEALDSLPGIGPSKAQAIIDYRTKNGPFQQVEDLLNVKGIGAKTLEQFRDQVVVR
jgi:competence protein ComEA